MTEQHRCADPNYNSMLNHIPHWPPTDELLHELQEGRLPCPSGTPNLQRMLDALQQRPQTTILTISKNAAQPANDVVIYHFYNKEEPLATLQLNNDRPPQVIYRGMHIIVTCNRNKALGVVNEQEYTVYSISSLSARQASGVRLPSHI